MANQVTTISFVQVPANANPDGVKRIMDAVDGDPGQVLAKAQAPTPEHYGFLGRLFDEPDITAEAVVDNGLTPVSTELVDLTDQGVTFPATTKRLIKWRHWVQTENDRYFTEYEQWVLGGSTPTLLGDRRVVHSHGIIAGTNTAFGAVRLAGTTSGATVTAAAETASGWSLGNFSSGAATLTMPASRATPRVVGQHFAEDAGTIGDFRDLQIRGITAGGTTATVETATVNGTEAVSSPNGTNNYDMTLFALPPGDCNLVVNSTHLEMQITGIASDETRHRCEIIIKRAVQVAFQGS